MQERNFSYKAQMVCICCIREKFQLNFLIFIKYILHAQFLYMRHQVLRFKNAYYYSILILTYAIVKGYFIGNVKLREICLSPHSIQCQCLHYIIIYFSAI
jgi:hypothetical protein